MGYKGIVWAIANSTIGMMLESAVILSKILNPATEEVLAEVPLANETDILMAVDAANRAFKGWRWVLGLERAELLQDVARKIRERLVNDSDLRPLVESEATNTKRRCATLNAASP